MVGFYKIRTMKLRTIRYSKLMLTVVSLLLTTQIDASIHDSIGIEKKDGKTFVLHQVDAKETLYSISKKYAQKIEDVKAANIELGDGVKVGQIIRIPYKGKVQALPGVVPAKEVKPTKIGKIHKVEPKETLFGIAKKYSVSVDAIKKANPELIDGLKEGMEIEIPSSITPASKNVVAKPKDKIEDVAKVSDKEEVIIAAPIQTQPKGDFKKVIEKGSAELLESKTEAPKFQALHKTAPIGTIIQVINDSNGQKIFVRVIGRLVGTTDANVIIKISQKAMERLDVKSNSVVVTLMYIP